MFFKIPLSSFKIQGWNSKNNRRFIVITSTWVTILVENCVPPLDEKVFSPT